MKTTVLLWALWVNGGGDVNGGYLVQPYISAYFETKEQCLAVRQAVIESLEPKNGDYVFQRIAATCIQANYVMNKPAGAP